MGVHLEEVITEPWLGTLMTSMCSHVEDSKVTTFKNPTNSDPMAKAIIAAKEMMAMVSPITEMAHPIEA